MWAHAITAVYSAEANFAGSVSTALNQTVVPTQRLYIPTTLPGLAGAVVTVPVMLSDSDYLDNVDVAISYDATRLDVAKSDIQKGSLTSDFYFVVNLDVTAGVGTINVSMSRPSGPLSVHNLDSVLFSIQFHVKPAAPVGTAFINLLQGNGGFMTALHASDPKWDNNGKFVGEDLGNFDLEPPPANTADADDGSIVVHGVTTTTVSSTVNQSVFGQAVTFTATVQSSNGVPTGTVTFSDGSTSIGTGSVSGTTATFSTASLTVATHTITAVYGGDNNFTGSAPATVLQTVFQAHTTTSLAFSLNPSTAGQTVTFTATVVANTPGSGIATGTITFDDGSMSIGTGLIDGTSTATFTTSSLTQGNHQISAVFAGDSNFFGSISPTLTQTVNIVSLRVSTFTPTATGFTAIFNRPLGLGTVSSPVLNLYDNASGTLGPVDVTLVRASNGASINGSLVVNSTGTQITFAETGQSGVLGSAAQSTLFGVLPNDTYTVTLRSATNGFKDANGNLLDGNADGTPGGDYVTTFVVNNSSSSVTVTLPDFARGAGQLVNVPNTVAADNTFTTGLPLRLYNGISFTGSTTIDSQTVQVLTTAGLAEGDTVTGPGIPTGTTISSISSDGTPTITLSQAATETSAALVNGGVVLNDSHGDQTITSVSLTLAYNPSLLSVDRVTIFHRRP